MRASVLDRLVCPHSGHRLEADVLAATGAGPDAVVEFAVLSGPTADFPVLCGVPVFVPVPADVLGLLRAGRHEEATALAAFAGVARSRKARALELGRRSRLAAPVVGPLAHTVERRFQRRARAAVFGGGGSPLDPVRFAYADAADASDYFQYRYSTPRHLVALSCIEADLPAGGLVLDVGCGAGHLTWAITQRAGEAPVVGVERELFLLLAANRLATGADFVCADATSLPFPPASVERVFAFDVLSFVTLKRALVGELARVLGPGGRMALTSVINARTPHVYAGEPLAPEGWRALVAHRPHRLLADADILRRYLEGQGLPAAGEPAPAVLDHAPTLTVLVRPEGELADAAPFDGWPHARGPLAVNPLYAAAPAGPDRLEYERRMPSAVFAADNPGILDYLPEHFGVDRETAAAAAAGRWTAELEPLVRSLALLTLPPAFPGARWPGFGEPAAGRADGVAGDGRPAVPPGHADLRAST